MSLVCGETGKNITFRSTFYAVTRRNGDWYIAVLERIIEKIPEELRRTKPSRRGRQGLDIHRSSSSAQSTRGGAYSRGDGFKLGEFQFSISKTTAKQYLPQLFRQYCQSKKSKK